MRPNRSGGAGEAGSVDAGGDSGGGLGTRIGEETAIRPKPMVEIRGMPILWHILKIYDRAGITDLIIASATRAM